VAKGLRVLFCGINPRVLPNPSGLNAHYPLRDLVALYRQLSEALA
jgi:G:T/U-mismatch repair DNA glycosylase